MSFAALLTSSAPKQIGMNISADVTRATEQGVEEKESILHEPLLRSRTSPFGVWSAPLTVFIQRYIAEIDEEAATDQLRAFLLLRATVVISCWI